jgi:hypothetical protein
MTRTISNEEGLELVLNGRAQAIPTSLSGVSSYSLYHGHVNQQYSYSIDSRELIKFNGMYFVRDRYMDYEQMHFGVAYGKDGSRREVKILDDEEW